MSIGEAARTLGVPVTTLRHWINTGKVSGVCRTRWGHRRIAPEGLAAFARGHWRRGRKFPVECRSEPRIRVSGTDMTIKVLSPKSLQVLGTGEGRLVDMSAHGFKVDGLKWESPFVPSTGSRFAFESRRRRGVLNGIRGTASLVWSVENRKERGGVLGARVEEFGKTAWREAWERCVEGKDLN